MLIGWFATVRLTYNKVCYNLSEQKVCDLQCDAVVYFYVTTIKWTHEEGYNGENYIIEKLMVKI